jgi:hydroxymethylpyrimidine/phosphomethylpyrimidine kinase
MSGTTPPVALTIAGFDPSGGAGITADLKTFAAHRMYGVACISALTVQSTQGVQAVQELSPEIVRRTLDCLADDLQLDGAKIGMLGTAPVVSEVASFLKRLAGATSADTAESKIAQLAESKTAQLPRARVVLDPVLLSSSGAALLDSAGVGALIEELLVATGWITPNSAELAVLIGSGPVAQNDIPEAARRLQELASERGNRELNVVVTGGDLERPDDYLLLAGGEERWLRGTQVKTTSTHGTGCAFSSALLCHLIAGETPADAVASAKTFVAEALRSAYPLGKGKGPPDHFFRLWAPGR